MADSPIPIVNKPDVPKPDKLLAKQARQEAIEATKEGWWSITAKGLCAGVWAAIDANAAIPDYWKATLKTDAQNRCGQSFNFVSLDAHYVVENGNAVLHLHIECSTILV